MGRRQSVSALNRYGVQPVRRLAALNRSDILGALADYAASQSALQLEIARQFPDMHIGPGYLLDQTDNKWTLGATLTLPVLNQNQGAIAEAKARREEMAARFAGKPMSNERWYVDNSGAVTRTAL